MVIPLDRVMWLSAIVSHQINRPNLQNPEKWSRCGEVRWAGVEESWFRNQSRSHHRLEKLIIFQRVGNREVVFLWSQWQKEVLWWSLMIQWWPVSGNTDLNTYMVLEGDLGELVCMTGVIGFKVTFQFLWTMPTYNLLVKPSYSWVKAHVLREPNLRPEKKGSLLASIPPHHYQFR